MLDTNNKFRLQLLNHDEIFANREDANKYIVDYLKPDVLYAEPAVVFYGEKNSPSALIALGSGDKKVYVIDISKIEEEVANLQKNGGIMSEDVNNALKLINNLIEVCGLEFDTNKINDQISYNPDHKDVVIGESKTISEAINLLSKYAQEVNKSSKFIVADSNSVKLTYKEDLNTEGNILKAKVKISDNGDSDEEAFNNNILGVKSDGLYAAVHLEYDETKNELKFYSSGMKNGRFQDDAKKNVIKLGKHSEVIASNNDDNPVKVSVETENNINKVSAKLSLSEHDNILKVTDGKLAAYVSMSYNETNNQISFTNGIETKTFTLNSGGVIERTYYDASTETIVIVFKLSNGNTSEVRIPVREILNEWGVDNTGTTVTLVKTIDSGSGKDLLSADVNVSQKNDNILIKDGNSLYVGGVASNIRYKKSTVAKTLDSLEKADSKLAEDLLNEINDRTNSIEKVVIKLEQEIKDREHADEDIKHLLEDLKKELDITELREEIKKFEEGYAEFEKEWAMYKPQIEKAIADAESVAGRVKILEEKIIEDETKFANIVDRVSSAETDIKNNSNKIETNTQSIIEESKIARAAEGELKNSIDKEIIRSTNVDDELRNLINTNTTNVNNLKTSVSNIETNLATEIERATSAETNISNNIANEITRASNSENALGERITDLNNRIDTVTDNTNKMRNDIDSEIIRATLAETHLEEKINDVKTLNDTLNGDINLIKSDISSLQNSFALESTERKTQDTILDSKIETNAQSIEKLNSQLSEHVVNTSVEIQSKVDAEKERAMNAENGLQNSIEALQQTDIQIAKELSRKIENVTLEKAAEDSLEYVLKIDGIEASRIVLPKDQFLKSVEYLNDSKLIRFVFVTENGETTTDINVSDLVDTYTAGDGLKLENNIFSVQLDNHSESYLTVTEQGLSLNGIDEALAEKVNTSVLNDYYTKNEAENIFLKEHQDISGLASKEDINSVKNDINNISETVIANKTAIDTLTGTGEGSVTNALNSSKYYTDEKIRAEEEARKEADRELNSKLAEKASASDLNGYYTKEQIDEKNFVTKLDAVEFAKTTDVEVIKTDLNQVKTDLNLKANASEVYTKETADSIFLTTNDANSTYATIEQNNVVKEIAEQNKLDIVSLNNTVEGLKYTVESSDTVNLSMSDQKILKAELRINNELNNALSYNGNGAYVNVSLSYNKADNKLTFNTGNASTEIELAGAPLVTGGHYDSVNKKVVLEIEGGDNIEIPVNDLFNQLKAINPDNDPVNLVIEHNMDGQDTIQANLNISDSSENLIMKGNGTLFASNRAKEHWMKLDGIGEDVDVQSAVNTVKRSADTNARELETIKSNVENIKSDLTNLTETVNQHTNDITDVKGRLSIAENNIATNKANIDSLTSKTDSHEQRIINIENRLTTVEGNINNIQTNLTSMQTTIENIQKIINGEEGQPSLLDRIKTLEDICNNLIDFGNY